MYYVPEYDDCLFYGFFKNDKSEKINKNFPYFDLVDR